jgi:hypothetical protein
MNTELTPPGASKGPTLPVKLLMLDGIGSMLLAAGMVLMIADPPPLLPPRSDYAEIGLGLVIIGVLFMLPLVAHLVAKARARAGGNSRDLIPPSP